MSLALMSTPRPRAPTRARIQKVIDRLIKAEIEDSWKGGGDPEDIPEIEKELRRARASFEKLLKHFR